MLATIKLNDSGDLVRAAKYLTGYSAVKKATGVFDEDFENHVKKWQDENGLTQTGVIDDVAWGKIQAGLPTCSTSKNSKSVYVCAIQALLGGLTVDGVYGTKTKKAVAAYQSASGLSSDGVCGPKTWASLIGGVVPAKTNANGSGSGAGQTASGGKVINNCVHYLQWDSKWKSVKYSTHTSAQTIGNSGCGPSSMAMIMATFIDKSITPVEMCDLAVKGGYRSYDNGTNWGFFEYVYNKYEGFSKFITTTSIETIKSGLKDGALAVCSMNSNDKNFWTKGGHFIVAIGYDSDGYIYANDPNKAEAPRKQLQNKFKDCLKNAFLFWPEAKMEEPVNKDETSSTTTSSRGTQIIDVSKHQGAIDWDKLAPNLAFAIIKASGLYKNGADPYYVKNVNGAVSHDIPFHAYHFLYCTTESEAKRDAALFYNTVKSAGHWPISWVLDCEKEWGVKAKNAANIAKVFEEELRRLAGSDIKVGVYIGHNVYQSYALDYDHYDFVWIPRYGSNNGTISGSTKPDFPCDLWQYTSTAKIAGVSGNVDMSVITGDGKSLDWFINSAKTEKVNAPAAVSTPAATQTAATGKTVKISGGNCYVRTASSTTGGIIGVAYSGQTFPYAGITSANGWLLINFNGKTGWVSGKYGNLI